MKQLARVLAVGALGFVVASAAGAAERGLSGQMHGEGPGQAGCFPGPLGDDWIRFQENGFVDSYDSRIAAYDPDNPGALAVAGTNCHGPEAPWATIDNNSTIRGDVSVVSDSSLAVQTENNAVITGTVKYGQPEWELKAIVMPGFYTAAGDEKIIGEYQDKQSADYLIVDNVFKGSTNGEVTFNPGVFHFAGMQLENNFIFHVGGTEGIVEIYIDNSVVFENNSVLLPPIQFQGDTTRLRLYYNGAATVDLSNNVHFYGFIYAPNALIEIRNNTHIYGNLVGDAIKIWNNAALHYDLALGSGDFGGVIGAPKPPPETTDWRELIKTQ